MLLHGGESAIIGKYCYCSNPAISVRYGDGTSKLVMGNYCSLAGGVTIFLGGEHGKNWVSTFPFNVISEKGKTLNHSKGDVVIGSDVWIGTDVTIISGVTIGDGAILGANAVIAKDVPPYAVAAGNPARIIRYRFDTVTIRKLLAIKWWHWPDQKVQENIHLLSSDNIEDFANAHYADYGELAGVLAK